MTHRSEGPARSIALAGPGSVRRDSGGEEETGEVENASLFSKKIISCCDCGEKAKPRTANQKRCSPCADVARLRWAKAAHKKWRRKSRVSKTGRCTRCDKQIGRNGVCDQCAAYVRAWKKRNPQRGANDKARRKARAGKLSKGIAGKLLLLQRGRCVYCKSRLGADAHLDHIVPVSAGGTNQDSNIQLLCRWCNLSKGAKDPTVFAQRLGMLL